MALYRPAYHRSIALYTFDPLPAATRAVQLARRGEAVSFDEGEVGDLEREALIEGLPQWRASHAGHLYLAANASWPGLHKIGCTRRAVEKRMAELSGTGMATPWFVVFSWEVYDAFGLEAQVKRACEQWRVPGQGGRAPSELFAAHYSVLRETVDRVIAADIALLERGVGPEIVRQVFDAGQSGVCQNH